MANECYAAQLKHVALDRKIEKFVHFDCCKTTFLLHFRDLKLTSRRPGLQISRRVGDWGYKEFSTVLKRCVVYFHMKILFLSFRLINMAKPVRLRPRPAFMDKAQKVPTRLIFSDTEWGFTWGSPENEDANATPLSNFRLFCQAFIPSHGGNTANQPGGGVEVTVKTAARQYQVILDADTLLNKNAVLAQMGRQCTNAVFIASGLSSSDWMFLIDKAMAPLLEEYGRNPSEKQPIKYIGLQAQLLPQKLSDLKESDVCYFFNQKDGVLDCKGDPLINSTLVFDPTQMRGVQQIDYEDSGLQGFLRFINPPLAPTCSGDPYFEYMLTAVFPFCYGWASPFNSQYLKKMPTLILEGEPNARKTTRARTALAAGSSSEAFFSGSSSIAGIQEFTASFTMLTVLDDLESRRTEEKIVLIDYEQATTQTISGGGRRRKAPLMLTMNPQEKMRQHKFLSGRCIVLNCTKSRNEPGNMFQILNDILSVNETVSTQEKPFKFLMEGED